MLSASFSLCLPLHTVNSSVDNIISLSKKKASLQGLGPLSLLFPDLSVHKSFYKFRRVNHPSVTPGA